MRDSSSTVPTMKPLAAGDSLWRRFQRVRKAVRQTGRLMCGIPDYDTYVAHCRQRHPDRPVMSYEEFFKERQNARYGAKGNVRGCC